MTPYEKVIKLTDEERLDGELFSSHSVETIAAPDVANVNRRIEWLQSTGTQDMIKELKQESEALVSGAIALATVNHQSDNSKQIVHKLIEANVLRKLVGKYASIK